MWRMKGVSVILFISVDVLFTQTVINTEFHEHKEIQWQFDKVK